MVGDHAVRGSKNAFFIILLEAHLLSSLINVLLLSGGSILAPASIENALWNYFAENKKGVHPAD